MAGTFKNIQKQFSAFWRGSFLDQEAVVKHLPFLGYLLALALISIWASHKADEKTKELARLQDQYKEVKSEYIETKSRLMQLSAQSKIIERTESLGLIPQQQPPKKIVVPHED